MSSHPKVLCAWCWAQGVLTIISEGSLPASHGICDPCATGLQTEADQIIRPQLFDDDGQRLSRPSRKPVDPWLVNAHCPPVGTDADLRD